MRLATYRRRAGRGVRGLGQETYQQWYASLPSSCFQFNDPTTGNIISDSGPCYLPPAVMQAEVSQPAYQPSPLDYVDPTVAATAANPTFVTANVTDAPLTANTADLEGHLAQAVVTSVSPGLTLAQATAIMQGVASQYCALYGNAPGGGDTQCGNQTALIAQYAQQLYSSSSQAAAADTALVKSYSTGIAPNQPAYSTTYSSHPAGSTATNAATQTNAITTNAPSPNTNPALQRTTSRNVLSPPSGSVSGSVATGQQSQFGLNPNNTLNTDTIANTAAGGGPLTTTGDNTWIWVAAIAAGVLLLMMSAQGSAA